MLWSQEMEDLAAEKRKQEEAKLLKEKEHKRLSKILKAENLGFGGNDMLDTSKQRLSRTLALMKQAGKDNVKPT